MRSRSARLAVGCRSPTFPKNPLGVSGTGARGRRRILRGRNVPGRQYIYIYIFLRKRSNVRNKNCEFYDFKRVYLFSLACYAPFAFLSRVQSEIKPAPVAPLRGVSENVNVYRIFRHGVQKRHVYDVVRKSIRAFANDFDTVCAVVRVSLRENTRPVKTLKRVLKKQTSICARPADRFSKTVSTTTTSRISYAIVAF